MRYETRSGMQEKTAQAGTHAHTHTHTHTHTGGLGCIVAEADGGGGDDGVVQEVDGEVLCIAVSGVPAVVVLSE